MANMKKIVLFLGLFLILHSSTVRSQTIDVNLSGRISGDFTMPTDNFYDPADWGGAYLYVDDFVTSPSDTNLTINLRFKNDKSKDSLNIFLGLNEYSNSLIDSNNFTIVYDTASFLTFLYYFVDLPDPYIDGIQIYSTTNNPISINSVELSLTNQHFNFGEQEFLLFCLHSNIPRGNVMWMPLQVGNIWEYNEYVQSDSTYADFQYKITDSLQIDMDTYYVIEKWKLNNLVWLKIAQDSIKTDSLNNLVDKNNQYYFFAYNPLGWWHDYVEYIEPLGRVAYVTEFYDIIPGLDIHRLGVTGMGILNYYYTFVGSPPNYDFTLRGARINNVIVFGAFTDIRENFLVQPKEFFLQQNYPNPFNPSTNISYSIPEQSFVTLKVYDLLGREVATLVNGEKQTGYYETEFDGSNLPSGVYFYQLRVSALQSKDGKAHEYVETRKMILMR
jgi:hypothetical protein